VNNFIKPGEIAVMDRAEAFSLTLDKTHGHYKEKRNCYHEKVRKIRLYCNKA
jgi:hypothetical protein